MTKKSTLTMASFCLKSDRILVLSPLAPPALGRRPGCPWNHVCHPLIVETHRIVFFSRVFLVSESFMFSVLVAILPNSSQWWKFFMFPICFCSSQWGSFRFMVPFWWNEAPSSPHGRSFPVFRGFRKKPSMVDGIPLSPLWFWDQDNLRS